MAVKKGRIKNVVSYANEYSDEEASDHFGVKESTIERYRRKANELNLSVGTYEIPRILLIDIETSPLETYSWGVYKQYIDPKYVKKWHSIITYSAKWLCESDIISNRVSPKKAKNRKDKSIVSEIFDLFEEADIIIAHNLNRFDEKEVKKRFFMNGLNPPSPYQTIDTLKEIRKEFNFPSNKLEVLNDRFGLSRKDDIGFSLWDRCVSGGSDADKALTEMLEYNEQDVRALEDLYFEIRGWIKSHPNVGLYYSDIEDRCPNCGSKSIEYNGTYNTNVNEYDAYRCKDCGAYGRSRHTNLSEEDKRTLKRSVAR